MEVESVYVCLCRGDRICILFCLVVWILYNVWVLIGLYRIVEFVWWIWIVRLSYIFVRGSGSVWGFWFSVWNGRVGEWIWRRLNVFSVSFFVGFVELLIYFVLCLCRRLRFLYSLYMFWWFSGVMFGGVILDIWFSL